MPKGQNGSQPGAGGSKQKPDTRSVGPDGITYEKAGKAGSGSATSEDKGWSDQPKRGSAGNGPNDRDDPNATQPSPKPEKSGDTTGNGSAIAELFRPGSTPSTAGSAGPALKRNAEGTLSRGEPGRAPERIEDITDPVERAAAQRLQQAIQRIQTNRDRHAPKPSAGRGDPANQDQRRDW
jgi:hypothetical protein